MLDLFHQDVAPEPPLPPNPRRWAEGDLVLHRRDPKTPHMLLRVLGYPDAAHVACRFISDRYNNVSEVRKNPQAMGAIQIIALANLLDPSGFGIGIHNAPDAAHLREAKEARP